MDVARLAGFSRSTVSRILNGDDGPFPESTRRRVHEAAAKLNYRPSRAARSLVTGQSDTIVILVPDTRFGGHLQDSVDEVVTQTRQFGGNVVVRIAGSETLATLDALLGLNPFVVLNFGVLSTSEVAILTRRGIIVLPKATGVRGSNTSDPGIARLQGEVLRRHGDRQIWYAMAATERPEPFSEERHAALRAYCDEVGAEAPRLIRVTGSVEGGRRALENILSPGPAAVACYNDDVALTLLAGARELNAAVPDDVALVGVDHRPAGQLWAPRLTTIHVNMHGYIANVVSELREELEGQQSREPEPLQSLFTLIAGETA